MTKRETIQKLRTKTVKISGTHYISYKDVIDALAELEERPIIIKNVHEK